MDDKLRLLVSCDFTGPLDGLLLGIEYRCGFLVACTFHLPEPVWSRCHMLVFICHCDNKIWLKRLAASRMESLCLRHVFAEAFLSGSLDLSKGFASKGGCWRTLFSLLDICCLQKPFHQMNPPTRPKKNAPGLLTDA